MIVYKHSVSLDADKCKGCTTCLRRCPTQAIRIRDGKACINPNLCIDCGECIRHCPYKAKKADFDQWDSLDRSKFLIALPAPSLFGQFANLDDTDYLLQGLMDLGFNDIFEIAKAAELVTDYTRAYMQRMGDAQAPFISTACPVVVRLISLRFPTLRNKMVPVAPPIELAGKLAKERALKEHPELKPEDVRTVFISPCPAKVSWVKNTPADKECYVDYVVSMSDVYFRLLSKMDRKKTPKVTSESGAIGMSWPSSGGEASALMNDHYLAADGVENIIRVLDDIEMGHFPDLKFVEMNACPGGCVGGVMTVENPYIARVRIRSLQRYMPIVQNRISLQEGEPIPREILTVEPGEYSSAELLNADRAQSFRMMSEIERIWKLLPGMDCGSCGAPTCRAHAEDVVRGESSLDDCVIRMREQLKALQKEDGKGEES
ncbi:MAG: 4Fe-4S binding protein [Clostridia bacterium]|nr:4Fe-4S binding protein [Clostridia bacterium]MBR2644720.1 4Fe-4S binding protein [Clostridia bacterium]MBR3038777.1 4Fe-4S binding protein [Clostridia bacterium]MBR3130836.1 4Fe-4S binding protein [Clostridia bacterium]